MSWTVPDKSEGDNDIQSILFQEYLDVLVAGLAGVDCVLEGCAVTGGSDMTPAVASGTVLSNGVRFRVTAADVTIGTAHSTNPRLDLIVVTSAGALAVRAGTAAAAPKPPARTANDVVLAVVYVPANDTTIGAGAITDLRVVRTDLIAARRPPDIIMRSGQGFSEPSFVGAGYWVANANVSCETSFGDTTIVNSLPALTIAGHGVTSDDVASLIWGQQSLSTVELLLRGDAAGLGGFRIEMRLHPLALSLPTNLAGFFGVRPAAMAANEAPLTSAVGCFGIGFNIGDANLSFLHNDGSGAPTVVALGANFPVEGAIYDVVIECEPNSSSMTISVHNLGNGAKYTASPTTNLPAALTRLLIEGCVNKTGADDSGFLWKLCHSNVWIGSPYYL